MRIRRCEVLLTGFSRLCTRRQPARCPNRNLATRGSHWFVKHGCLCNTVANQTCLKPASMCLGEFPSWLQICSHLNGLSRSPSAPDSRTARTGNVSLAASTFHRAIGIHARGCLRCSMPHPRLNRLRAACSHLRSDDVKLVPCTVIVIRLAV